MRGSTWAALWFFVMGAYVPYFVTDHDLNPILLILDVWLHAVGGGVLVIRWWHR